MPMDRRQASSALTELALYAVSALISFALLNNVLKKLDPNQQNNKQARARVAWAGGIWAVARRGVGAAASAKRALRGAAQARR
jgi:hypothetical protein